MTSTRRPSVSVITPAFNSEPYLASTIASVRSQTFPDFEHIIIDDGSHDRTIEVAQALASDDDRVRVIRHPDGGNHGVSASRNLGLAEACGGIVGFLDADDEWQPNMLADQLAVFDRAPSTTLAFARARCIDGDGHSLQHPDWPHMEWIIGHAPAPGPLAHPFGDFVSKTAGIPIVTTLARRSTIIDIGGFAETLRHQVEDALLLARLCREGEGFFNETILARYRVHEQGYTASLTGLSDADSVWELYRELSHTSRAIEPELAFAMLGCIDRFLTAPAVPWKVRMRRVRGVGDYLRTHNLASPAQVRMRLMSAFPRYFKRRMSVAIRRWSKLGPTPIRRVKASKPS